MEAFACAKVDVICRFIDRGKMLYMNSRKTHLIYNTDCLIKQAWIKTVTMTSLKTSKLSTQFCMIGLWQWPEDV